MRLLTAIVAVGTAFGSSPALSGGYDTPILFSAQHMGMGGAAIAYVDDPSAIFHNPAGLARTNGLTLFANASLLTGTIVGAPDSLQDGVGSITSEQVVSVAPLVGASYRINDWFAAGLAFYPVAAAGATYEYGQPQSDGSVLDYLNSTSVLFLELSPSVAFKLPYGLKLGLGYRISFVSLDRQFKPQDGGNATFDAGLSGTNVAGFRGGLQWDITPELQFGVSYRHKTTTKIEDTDGAEIFATPLDTVTTEFILPSQLGFGLRGNFGDFSGVLDVQYTFQSQNQRAIFNSTPADLALPTIFAWEDNLTLRPGVEYRLDSMALRLGYIFDGQVNVPEYASAFGTPPAPTHTVTAGWGMTSDDNTWELNAAVAYRFGSANVTQADLDSGTKGTCLACGNVGDYEIGLFGLYVDFAYRFDLD